MRRLPSIANPDHWVDSVDHRVYARLSVSLCVTQALLRATQSLRERLAAAGIASNVPQRTTRTDVAGTEVTDAFLLGLGEDRLLGVLNLAVLRNGAIRVQLTTIAPRDDNKPFVEPARHYARTRPLGRVSWKEAAIEGADEPTYSRSHLFGQFEALLEANGGTLLGDGWADDLVATFEP